jgi:hypothetical protein
VQEKPGLHLTGNLDSRQALGHPGFDINNIRNMKTQASLERRCGTRRFWGHRANCVN